MELNTINVSINQSYIVQKERVANMQVEIQENF